MKANVAVLQPQAGTGPCAQTLTQINESLQARERLLTASARASRLLLEAPDVRAVIPGVLGLIGEAARVDRVNLMQTQTGPHGERLLAVVSEWTAEHGTLALPEASVQTRDGPLTPAFSRSCAPGAASARAETRPPADRSRPRRSYRSS